MIGVQTQAIQRVMSVVGSPAGYQKISGAAASTALTVPSGATHALIAIETQPVRWRDDGSAPTATDGMLVAAASSFWYYGDLATIRFIQTAASTVIHVSYYK